MTNANVSHFQAMTAGQLGTSSSPLIAPTGNTTVDAVADVVNRTVAPFADGPPEGAGTVGVVSHYLNAGLGIIGAPFEMLDTGFAMLTSGLAKLWPAFPAATLFGTQLGIPHAHLHPPSWIPPLPPIPLPSFGVALLAGCMSCLIGGIPAARASDVGLAPTCIGFAPAFEIYTGSSNVFIGGSRAARMFDVTRHCNPLSALGLFGTAMSAVGVAAGALSAVAANEAGDTLTAAVTGAQAVADAAALALSLLLGKDPGIPFPFGMMMDGNPTVLIGGFPMPDVLELLGGLRKLANMLGVDFGKKMPDADTQKTKCTNPGEPVEVTTGVTYNDFEDFIEPDGFRWIRHYRSDWGTQVGPLGGGFRHFYDRRLRFERTHVVLEDWNGERFRFTRSADGRHGGCAGGWVLEQLDERRFIATRKRVSWVFVRQAAEALPVEFRSEARRATFERDATGALLGITEQREHGFALLRLRWANGRIAAVEHGWAGQAPRVVCRYEYEDNQLLRHADAFGHVEHYVYDDAGRMTRCRNRNGYEFAWRYDAEGRCIHTSGADGLWRASMTYEPGRTIVEKANGGRWLYTYDDDGVLASIVDPYDGVISYACDRPGRIKVERRPGGRVYEWLYDENGEHTGRLDESGHVHPPLDEQPVPPPIVGELAPTNPREYLYGDLPAHDTQRPALPAIVEAVAAELAVGARPVVRQPAKRDLLGRVLVEYDACGFARRFERDREGNVVVEIDADGQPWTRAYASWNIEQQVRDPLGHVTQFRRDSHTKITDLVDANGARTRFEYDLRDRLTRIIRHGQQHERYVYDGADNLIAKYDANDERLVEYRHAPGRRLTAMRTASGASYSYGYDRAGNIVAAQGPAGQQRLGWDWRMRRELDVRDELGVRHRRVRAGWTSMVYFERFAVEYRSDAAGRRLVYAPGQQRAHVFRASADGYVLTELAHGSSMLEHFDARGLCTAKLKWQGRAHELEFGWNARYQYSPTGELREAADGWRGATRYEYDAAHRLVAEYGNTLGRAWSYDAAGNLLTTPALHHIGYREGNRVADIDGRMVEHDARQRIMRRQLASGDFVHYGYDDLDQLTRVRWDGDAREWEAGYDGLNRRVFKRWGEQRWDYWWDGERLAAERDPAGRLRIYVYVDERARVPFMFIDYDSLTAPAESGRDYYLTTNQVGLPVLVEDSRGRIVWWAEHIDPYGGVIVHEGAELELNLRFPGHYYDAELELHYNRFRYYDPGLGRYVQPDPIGIAGGYDIYAYAHNPLAIVDIDGLHSKKDTDGPTSEATNNKKPQGESTESKHPRPVLDKPLSAMSPEECKMFCLDLANHINEKMRSGWDANTYGAAVVQNIGDVNSRKVVITSSIEEIDMPPKVQAMLDGLDADFEWRNKGPILVEAEEVGVDVEGTKWVEQIGEGDDMSYQPYYKYNKNKCPEGETRHHAEQRMVTALEEGEEIVALSPSRPCCAGCWGVLGSHDLQDTVPTDRWPKTK